MTNREALEIVLDMAREAALKPEDFSHWDSALQTSYDDEQQALSYVVVLIDNIENMVDEGDVSEPSNVLGRCRDCRTWVFVTDDVLTFEDEPKYAHERCHPLERPFVGGE